MEADTGTLSTEKIQALRSVINDHLKSNNVYGQIKDFLADFMKQQNGRMDEDQVVAALQEKGIIDGILKTLGPPMSTTKRFNATSTVQDVQDLDESMTTSQMLSSLKANKRILHVKILGGKAFLEQLFPNEEKASQKFPPSLILYVHFRNQRFKTRPTMCSVEPAFDDSFFLELQDTTESYSDLLLNAMNFPIHLVVVKRFPDGTTSLIGTHFLEWRKVSCVSAGSYCGQALVNGIVTLSAELIGLGAKVVGLIDFRLELIPKPNMGISDRELTMQLRNERSRETEAVQLFFAYAKSWWKEYAQISTSHEARLIKIFAQTEYGIDLPVCAFVKPMRAGRLLDSPRHAAVFVSLLPFERDEDLVVSGRKEVWSTTHTFLCKGKGSVEDHCILLCSLLLGFGLNAYVCIGTDDRGGHAWVMTRGTSVIFWESLTGKRFKLDDPNQKLRYRTVECVFNHTALYANNQIDVSVQNCIFDLEAPRYWKSMSQESVTNSISCPLPPPLLPSTLQFIPTEMEIESSLQSLISEHRKGLGLSTFYDDNLSYLLTSTLSTYEMERLTGMSLANDEFQQSVKGAVPEGYTFLGFPIQFPHRIPARMMLYFLKSKVGASILECRGDNVRHAVRCKIFPYPESTNSVWCCIACRYVDNT